MTDNSQKYKPTALYSRRLSKPQCNYTATEKEILAIVEFLKQFRGIIFGYEINLFLDHKNLFYAANLSESQRVMRWQLILEEFGTNIQHIYGIDNIVADMLSRLPYNSIDKYQTCTRKAQCCVNVLFAIGRLEISKDCFQLNILIV